MQRCLAVLQAAARVQQRVSAGQPCTLHCTQRYIVPCWTRLRLRRPLLDCSRHCHAAITTVTASCPTPFAVASQAVAVCAGARNVAFFMHGVLDTSLGWVSNGSTGSQAFAASELGFDVWLGNSRANPPRAHRRELPDE